MAANVLTFNQSVYVEQTWCFWRHSLQELNQFTLAVYQHMVTQVSLSHYGFITNIARMIEVFSNATWNIIFWHSLQESNPFNLAVYQHMVTQMVYGILMCSCIHTCDFDCFPHMSQYLEMSFFACCFALRNYQLIAFGLLWV